MYPHYGLLIGAYLIWITAIILLICSQSGLLPLFGIVNQVVIASALIGMVVGLLPVLARGVAKLLTFIDRYH